MRLSVTSIVILVLFAFLLISARAQETQLPLIKLDQAVERELKGGESHSYSINLEKGQYMHLAVEQKSGDVAVALFDPLGKKLLEIDSQNPEDLHYAAKSGGFHRLEIVSFDKKAPPVLYEVRLLAQRKATDSDIKKVAAQRNYEEGISIYANQTAESSRAAIKKYEAALEIYRNIGDKIAEAQVLNSIGEIYFSLGERQKSLTHFAEALSLSRASGDKRSLASALLNVGAAYSDLGEKQKALEHYFQALPLLRADGEKFGEAATLNNIADVYSDSGEYQKALDFYSQALSLARAIGNKVAESTTLGNVGQVYRRLGDRSKALESYQKALPLQVEIANKGGEAYTLNYIGNIYGDMGESKKALAYISQALPIFRSIGDKFGEAYTLTNIGLVYSDLGERQKAVDYCLQALPLFRSIGDKRGEGSTLNRIGAIYDDLKEKPKALEFYSRALPILRLADQKLTEIHTLHNLFKFWNESNNRRYAAVFGKLSVNNFQKLRANIKELDKGTQQNFLKTVENIYRKLAESLIADNRLAEAQQVLNLFKDQQSFDFDSGKQIELLTFTAHEAVFVKDFDQKFEAIAVLSNRFDELKLKTTDQEQRRSIENDLQRSKDDYLAFLRYAAQDFTMPATETDNILSTVDSEQMQTTLRLLSADTEQKTVAVYQIVGDEKYSSLLITPDSIDAVSAPIKGAELNQKALQLWKLLQSPESDPRPLAADLYKVVFAPLASKLPKDTKTILWSLDGSLRYVPVAALYDGRNYLVEKYENVLFTRADKERLTRQVSTNWTGAGFGTTKAHTVELAGKRYAFDALGQVTFEMGRIFKQADSKGLYDGDVLLDGKFTKSSMLAELKKSRSFVHISSHFRFEPGNEARSFLLLGDGDAFTLDEMKRERDLFKGVELLTLSACQTASQLTDANGREVDALAELAQRLGAGAVMASLWDVDDISTADLMSKFYTAYGRDRKSNGATKAQALRQAQLSLLTGKVKQAPSGSNRKARDSENLYAEIKIDKAYQKRFVKKNSAPLAHPFYWAPFVIFGNFK